MTSDDQSSKGQELETLETASPAETPEADDTTADTDTEESSSRNSEAAKYRAQRNEARAERDAAIAQLQALQRSIIDGLCENAAVQPRALWLTTELSDLVNDDGTVNTEAVSAALGRARDELGIPLPAKGALAPRAGYQPETPPPPKNTFADAFAPRNRRAER